MGLHPHNVFPWRVMRYDKRCSKACQVEERGAYGKVIRAPIRDSFTVVLPVRRYLRCTSSPGALCDCCGKAHSRDGHRVGIRFQATSRP